METLIGPNLPEGLIQRVPRPAQMGPAMRSALQVRPPGFAHRLCDLREEKLHRHEDPQKRRGSRCFRAATKWTGTCGRRLAFIPEKLLAAKHLEGSTNKPNHQIPYPSYYNSEILYFDQIQISSVENKNNPGS